mmetsp:Transcript_32943/g.33555  ORF Transcript_32943/g.33555 Transcript_32943/m.33555 type:complete len:1209 (+) Transcript_32943:51-3677(+)
MSIESESVSDIWADMKKADVIDLNNLQKRIATTSKSKKKSEIPDHAVTLRAEKAREKDIKMLLVGQLGGISALSPNVDQRISKKKVNLNRKAEIGSKPETDMKAKIQNLEKPSVTVAIITAQEMMTKISRDINLSNSDKDDDRRRGLTSLCKLLFIEYNMSQQDYNEVFRDICKVLFKRYADSVEKCRELSLGISKKFFEKCSDMLPILPYFIPSIMQRLQPGLGYDEEMKVFIHDMESHDAYRRGKAVERQDKDGATSVQSHRVVDTSEEIRLLTFRTLSTLVHKLTDSGASGLLHPYFQEVIIYTQAQLRDPYPELKLEACALLQHLAEQEPYVLGMKFFAVALVREILPTLRHRHARVRAAGVSAVKAVVMVPDRDKRKGAGTEAIQDLVGFREENVLPVAGFYRADVQVNYLAEVAMDGTILVRERVVDMLNAFLTVLEDRYDHQTRLVPYLLDLLTDDVESVSSVALACLKTCGKLYEEEHPDDIIEKRQYGIDGDDRINLSKPLPPPFLDRPTVGIRLYVRGTSHRFLKALMNELMNWTSKTRVKSAKLLKLIVVLCEEHLTMEAYSYLPTLVKAVNFSLEDKDIELHALLMEICELTGRYIVPETFIHYILPRLRGDTDILQFSADSKYRVAIMEMMRYMLDGVKPTLIPNHFHEIVSVLTDAYVIDPESTLLRREALQVLRVLLNSLCIVCRKKSIIGIENDYFQSTGRLMTSFQLSLRAVFKMLVETLSHKPMRETAVESLFLLAEIEKGRIEDGVASDGLIQTLFIRYGCPLIMELLQSMDVEEDMFYSADFRTLQRLVECPWDIILCDKPSNLLYTFLHKLSECVTRASMIEKNEERVLLLVGSMLQIVLQQITYCQVSRIISSTSVHESYSKLVASDPHRFNNNTPVIISSLLSKDESADQFLTRALRAFHTQSDSLVQSFVLDTRWNRTSALQKQRIQLLQLMIMSPVNKSAGSEALGAVVDDVTTVGFFSNEFLTPSMATDIVQCAIQPSLRPGTVEEVRMIAMSVLNILCERMSGRQDIRDITQTTKGQLLSFKKREKSLEYISPQSTRFGSLCLYLLIEGLDDSSDEVSLEAVQALHHALSFVLPDASNQSVILPSEACNKITDEKVSEHVMTLSSLVHRVLKHVTSSIQSDTYLQELDSLLRAMAVLDPDSVNEIVRDQLGQLIGIHKAPSPASEIYSGLLEHCEMLLSFT